MTEFKLTLVQYTVTWIDQTETIVAVQHLPHKTATQYDKDAKSLASMRTGRPISEAMRARVTDPKDEPKPQAPMRVPCKNLSSNTFMPCVLTEGHTGRCIWRVKAPPVHVDEPAPRRVADAKPRALKKDAETSVAVEEPPTRRVQFDTEKMSSQIVDLLKGR